MANLQQRHCRQCGHQFTARDELDIFCAKRCAGFWLEGVPTADEARREDDPFLANASRFGPVGQYTTCRMCGGRFESRGLRLCPDCYEIRKKQPDFDDDPRWSSAAGKATAARSCLWCGNALPAYRERRKVQSNVRFCSASHAEMYRRASPEALEQRAQRLGELAG
jgi:hypothetical protein